MAFKRYLNKIRCGDCEEVLKSLDDNSVDLIITSPPYADLRKYRMKNNKELAELAPDNYVNWFLPKAKEFYRVLKPTGSFILNINDKTVGKFQHLYVFQLLLELCKEDIGFHLVRDYVWFNPATPPNSFSSGKFGRTKKSHEYCFWLSKGEEWTFNMDSIRRPYSDAMKIYLKGQGKGNRHHNTRPSTYSFDCEKVWRDKGGADPGSVLHIEEPLFGLESPEEFAYMEDQFADLFIQEPGDVLAVSNTGSKNSFKKLYDIGIKHPARFPERLVEFFIKAGSNEGDCVLDPFMGSGTTAVVAERLGRNWIGVELSEDYVKLANLRIEEERKKIDLDSTTQ